MDLFSFYRPHSFSCLNFFAIFMTVVNAMLPHLDFFVSRVSGLSLLLIFFLIVCGFLGFCPVYVNSVNVSLSTCWIFSNLMFFIKLGHCTNGCNFLNEMISVVKMWLSFFFFYLSKIKCQTVTVSCCFVQYLLQLVSVTTWRLDSSSVVSEGKFAFLCERQCMKI